MNKRVLIIESVHPILKEMLSNQGWECVENCTCTYADLQSLIQEFDGIVLRSRLPIDANLVNLPHRIKFVARSGSGLENIDVAACRSNGIEVISSPEGNADAVGEFAIMNMLACLNKLTAANDSVRNHLWLREEHRGQELNTQTVGLIGYGPMGKSVAKKLSGFGCKVIAHDKYLTNFSDDYVEEVTLAELQERATIVSLHIPLSEETKGYSNAAFFAGFRHTIFFINTSRGNQVEVQALLDAIDSGKVTGAALDVLPFEKASLEGLNENPLFEQLIQNKRIILSPHVAGWTTESYVKLSSVLAEKILAKFNY